MCTSKSEENDALRVKVGEHAHDWDYHVMQLPRGIDLIVGMDFMKDNDVSLLCGTQKVMFGYSVLNAITLDPSELTTENYGPDALELDESDSQMKIDVPEIASIHSEKEDDTAPPITNLFSLKGEDFDFDCDLCYNGEHFDKLQAAHAIVDDPAEFYSLYTSLRATDPNLSEEQRSQLCEEHEENCRSPRV